AAEPPHARRTHSPGRISGCQCSHGNWGKVADVPKFPPRTIGVGLFTSSLPFCKPTGNHLELRLACCVDIDFQVSSNMFQVDAYVRKFVSKALLIHRIALPLFLHQVRELSGLPGNGKGEEVDDLVLRRQPTESLRVLHESQVNFL